MILRVDTPQRRLLVGYLAALGAAVAYGTSTVVARRIVDDFSSPLVAAAFSLLFGAILVAALFHRDIGSGSLRAPKRAWLFIVLTGVSSTWGVVFLFLALTEAPVVLVAPLSGTHPLVSLVLSHFFLRRLEKVTFRTVIGALMVVIGVTLIAYGNSLQ